jgi:hypothetical protein
MQKLELLEMVLFLTENEIAKLSEEGILPDDSGKTPDQGLTSPVESDTVEPGLPPDSTEPGSDPGGMPGAPPDLDSPGGEESDMPDMPSDLGGGFGGGGFGGGGGGGGLGGSDDMSDDSDDSGTEEKAPSPIPYHPFKDANTTQDRLQVILDVAEGLAGQTQDPQKIFKAVKGLIQNGFSRPQEASKIISDLFNTEDPVLQQVSKRLSLYALGL